MNAIETLKKILTSEVCFLYKAKISSEEKIKIKVFLKSAVAIPSLILCGTQVNLSVCVGSDIAAISRSRCYNCLLCYERTLDRVGKLKIKSNKISQMMAHLSQKTRLRVRTKARGEKELKVRRCKCKQQSITMYHVRSQGWNWCLSFC